MALAQDSVECRICRSRAAWKFGEVEFFIGYRWLIYDCRTCGSLFTQHDNSAYERLYSERSSCYRRYTDQADSCKELFDIEDAAGLRHLLSLGPKYRFVIDELEADPKQARLLEIGSSRGHLTSYFILLGRDITGVDVSPTAISAAAAAFGDHFRLAGDPVIEARAPYDAIFHVGTIGCVADPVGMTRQLLGLLKPGGRLLFNAPNRESLALRGQLWVEGAPPPDLVTMFRPGFWRTVFDDVADVSEQVEIGAPMQNLLIGLRNLAGRCWRPPVPIPLEQSAHPPDRASGATERFWRVFERAMRRVAPRIGLLRFAPNYPAEYGLLVRMIRR